MAHPDVKVVQSKRLMAHPVGRGTIERFRFSLSTRLGRGSTAEDSAPTHFGRRLVPNQQRHRELGLVLALLVAATAVSASLPGGWTAGSASPSPSTSESPTASPIDIAFPDASSTWTPAPTPNHEPLMPYAPITPKPTPTPKPAPAKARVYSFVALGDSLTYGYGNPGPAWPALLDSEDANLRLVNNAGVSGDLTSGMLSRLNSDVFAYKPEVLFILGGTNDVGHNLSQATTIANLRSIIVAAKAKGIRIFMLTIPPENYPSLSPTIAAMNAAIIHLANSYSIVYIDIHAVLSTSTGVYVSKYTVDGLHFSAAGAQAVANAVYSRIHRLGF